MAIFFSNFNSIFNDAAQPWQLGFQDSAAPGFTGLVTLHNTIGFYLIIICFAVFWVIFSISYSYSSTKNPIAHKYLTHGTVIELIWTLSPALILIAIAFPSFRLLYLMDEVISPTLTIKAVGHQWYWCAPFNYLSRRSTKALNPVGMDCKGTGLSDVERLGECSMPVKKN